MAKGVAKFPSPFIIKKILFWILTVTHTITTFLPKSRFVKKPNQIQILTRNESRKLHSVCLCLSVCRKKVTFSRWSSSPSPHSPSCVVLDARIPPDDDWQMNWDTSTASTSTINRQEADIKMIWKAQKVTTLLPKHTDEKVLTICLSATVIAPCATKASIVLQFQCSQAVRNWVSVLLYRTQIGYSDEYLWPVIRFLFCTLKLCTYTLHKRHYNTLTIWT